MNRGLKRGCRGLWLAALTLCIVGCSRGPEPGVLQRDLQQRLDTVFGSGLFQVQSFRRYGSQPLAVQPGDGGQRLAVYYKAGLELQRDHRFSDWSGQSVSALHQALSAADKGIEGVEAQGNLAGDIIYAHGLGVYTQAGGDWVAVRFKKSGASGGESPVTVAVVAEVDAADAVRQPPATWQQQFTDDLQAVTAAMEVLPLDNSTAQLRGQLQAALTRAKLQVLQKSGKTALLSGPQRGDYYSLGQGLEQVASGDGVTSLPSPGAIENIRLLSNGLAPLAFTQSDLVASAYSGAGPFRRPAVNLRAVAALYPEPVQIVVRRDAGIGRLAALAGKRVNIGPDGTGTQVNARQVLALAGIDDSGFTRLGIDDSLNKLQAGRLDALFVTSALPSRYLQSAGDKIALLPLEPSVVEALCSQSGYIPYQIPAGVYPQVENPVQTVAVTAMLVADANAPDKQITALLKGLFESPTALPQFGERGGSLQKERALTGVTVPLHRAAKVFFQQGVSD